MKPVEEIDVYIKVNRKGDTVCMCPKGNPACLHPECDEDKVFRDRYLDWQKTMNGRY